MGPPGFWKPTGFRQGSNCKVINSLVVEYIVAIDVTRVPFPADAFLIKFQDPHQRLPRSRKELPRTPKEPSRTTKGASGRGASLQPSGADIYRIFGYWASGGSERAPSDLQRTTSATYLEW